MATMLHDRLLGNVFTKAIRDWLMWTVVAIVALLLIGAFYVAVMSTAGDAYVTMLADFPEPLAKIYGQQDGTNAGMAMAGMYSLMGPIVLLAYAIGLGASSAVGEEEARTLPILLTSPLRRRSVLVAKSLVAAIGVLVITAAMWLGMVLFSALFGLDISRHDPLAASVQLIGMVLLFGALALGISAWRGSSALGIGVAAGIAVLSYFVTTMVPVVEQLADLAKLTPWYLYTGAEALYRGLDPLLLFIAVAIAAACLATGIYTLERRDLRG
jgi:beta-exotoxin I transport system permease protein